ncbi:MAG: Na/Pi cotransporter family protein [Paracoccaceae bacterium]|nr:Na/Pi cotransporter family protein [Paracoccaceae bacterium]
MEHSQLILFLLHIAGAAALLIWSVRLVRTGVERAFSNHLRRWLRRSSNNCLLATGTGTLSAMLLQSSTAVAIMVSNFVTGGNIVPVVGIAILLGADVGSALVVQVLVVRQTFIVPLFLLLGVCLFLRGHQRRIRHSGRIFIGLALIFVSLEMVRTATAPLMGDPATAAVMRYLGQDMLTAFVIGALFALLVHSSVGAILLFITLVSQGLMPQSAAIAMVLGANLGGAMIAYMLTFSASSGARQVILANVVLRGGAASLTLFLITLLDLSLTSIGTTEAGQVINLHLLFNIGLTLVALPFIGTVLKLVQLFIKVRLEGGSNLERMSALNSTLLATPDRALACASRELMHIGEKIEVMLRSVGKLYDNWDEKNAEIIIANDIQVRKTNFQIKLYLAKLNRNDLEEDVSKKSIELSAVAVDLDSASDIIARNMVELAKRLDADAVKFSVAGQKEISDFHDRVLANVQLALQVMMTQSPNEARELVAEKEDIRVFEQKLHKKHLNRLRDDLAESIATSNIHQETLRALKQINTSFSKIAHPILSESGDLLESRLASSTKEPS